MRMTSEVSDSAWRRMRIADAASGGSTAGAGGCQERIGGGRRPPPLVRFCTSSAPRPSSLADLIADSRTAAAAFNYVIRNLGFTDLAPLAPFQQR